MASEQINHPAYNLAVYPMNNFHDQDFQDTTDMKTISRPIPFSPSFSTVYRLQHKVRWLRVWLTAWQLAAVSTWAYLYFYG